MPPAPPTPIWELDGPYGRERWFGQPGRYEQVLLGQDPISLDPKEGELPFVQARGSNCVHPGPWPFAFQHCPLCGTPLQPPPAAAATHSWSSPANGASGLPGPACHGVPDPAGREELPMPGPARLDFFVAGRPSRLLALDQTTGTLWGWVQGLANVFDGGRWRVLGHLQPALNLARWSWAGGGLNDGVALPGDTGPVWVTLSPRNATASLAKPALGVQRSLGGVAVVNGTPFVPVLANDQLAVCYRVSPELGWQCVPVVNAAGQAAAQVFAAPSVNANEAFWVGEHGQLFVRFIGGAATCEYRPWRDAWRPMQGVRPVLSPNGVFHQLGRLDGRQAFEALLPPNATPQRREFDRYVTSCGCASFAGMSRFREPWEPRRTEYRGDGSGFLHPLLAWDNDRFVVAECTPRTALRGFLETDPPEAATECRIMFAGSSVVPTDLRATLRVRSAWDIVPVVFGRNLLVYDLPANRCTRWPLTGA